MIKVYCKESLTSSTSEEVNKQGDTRKDDTKRTDYDFNNELSAHEG